MRALRFRLAIRRLLGPRPPLWTCAWLWAPPLAAWTWIWLDAVPEGAHVTRAAAVTVMVDDDGRFAERTAHFIYYHSEWSVAYEIEIQLRQGQCTARVSAEAVHLRGLPPTPGLADAVERTVVSDASWTMLQAQRDLPEDLAVRAHGACLAALQAPSGRIVRIDGPFAWASWRWTFPGAAFIIVILIGAVRVGNLRRNTTRMDRAAQRTCPRCAYPIRSLCEPCPECGCVGVDGLAEAAQTLGARRSLQWKALRG